MKYVERNGHLVETWIVWYTIKGFEMPVIVKGTEPEVREYMESEFGYMGRYHALTKKEESELVKIGFDIYIA